ncbi:unnamed protein product [Danaus chrysippus]|uniref:(African queen) hypothetical protein n=1 Tax=Danaus chrysippus TaxID=151541 RepID=A0A8J2QWN4_9NEOP|nr:unnamed protein product [Danaus chrysippus]CAG9571751.1 unnamed protein product [Danaus chrysippus]
MTGHGVRNHRQSFHPKTSGTLQKPKYWKLIDCTQSPTGLPNTVGRQKKIHKLREERKPRKYTDTTKYREPHRAARREACLARNVWYRHKCEHLESLYNKHDAFNLYKVIKTFLGSKKFTNHNVDEQNVPIMVIYRKKQVWKQYITSMFGDDTRSEYVPYAANDGYSILPEEIEKALGKAKTGKITWTR